jgi:hypothetical protein
VVLLRAERLAAQRLQRARHAELQHTRQKQIEVSAQLDASSGNILFGDDDIVIVLLSKKCSDHN